MAAIDARVADSVNHARWILFKDFVRFLMDLRLGNSSMRGAERRFPTCWILSTRLLSLSGMGHFAAILP